MAKPREALNTYIIQRLGKRAILTRQEELDRAVTDLEEREQRRQREIVTPKKQQTGD